MMACLFDGSDNRRQFNRSNNSTWPSLWKYSCKAVAMSSLTHWLMYNNKDSNSESFDKAFSPDIGAVVNAGQGNRTARVGHSWMYCSNRCEVVKWRVRMSLGSSGGHPASLMFSRLKPTTSPEGSMVYPVSQVHPPPYHTLHDHQWTLRVSLPSPWARCTSGCIPSVSILVPSCCRFTWSRSSFCFFQLHWTRSW